MQLNSCIVAVSQIIFSLQEDLKGAHHLTVLAEGSDPAQGTVKGRGLAHGIGGNGLAQGNAEGKGPAQGIGGNALAHGTAGGNAHAHGTAGGSAHAQGTHREGVEIGPGHQQAMGTTRQTRKHFPYTFYFRTSVTEPLNL